MSGLQKSKLNAIIHKNPFPIALHYKDKKN